MRVLVTGGAGYIGSILVARLIENGFEVNVLDDLSTGHIESIHPKAKFIEGSILKTEDIKSSIKDCSIVFHFAAKTIVSESVKSPEIYFDTNYNGTRKLLDICLINRIKHFVFSSTCAVYSATNNLISEGSRLFPTNPYAESKLMADKIIAKQSVHSGTNFVSLRFFNVAGSYFTSDYGWLRENHFPETHLIPKLVNNSDSDFTVYGTNYETKDGTCVRDYLDVTDLTNACLKILNVSLPTNYEILNLGSGVGHSVFEVINKVETYLQLKYKIVISEKRPGDSAVLVANTQKAMKFLKWEPLLNIDQTIINSIESLK